MAFNKKGFSTMMLIFFIFVALFALILLGAIFYALEIVDTTFTSIDFTIGNQSFNQTYHETLGIGVTAGLTALPKIGLMLLLGMVVVMMIVGYGLKPRSRLIIILDIFILIIVFIASVYISQAFDSFINSSPEFLDIYSNEFQNSARFLLALPTITTITGILIMIVTYLTSKRKDEVTVYGEAPQ